MLLDVITRVGAETGIDVDQQRNVLVSLFNAASKIFHQELEANRLYREMTLIVPPDKVISLPSVIGEVKGIRVHSTEMLVPLQTLNVPRYTNSTLLYKIKNWRDMGDSPIMRNIELAGKLTITCAAVETTPVTLKISGQTAAASRIEEEVVVNATSLQTTNLFTAIYNIACFDARDNDIVIKDGDGNEMATLGNKDKRTRYKIIDVSQIFWPMNDTVDGNSYIDVLYKIPFVLAKYDTDSFANTDDYDEALYHMMLHLHFMTQSGKETMAVAELGRATALLKATKDGTEIGFAKKLNWGRNKFYSLFTRGRHRLSGNDYGMYFGDFSDY